MMRHPNKKKLVLISKARNRRVSLGEPENRVVPIIAWRFQSRKIKEHLGDGDGYQIVRTRPGVYNLT